MSWPEVPVSRLGRVLRSRTWPILLASVSCLATVLYTARYAVNLPYWDEWAQVPLLQALYEHRLGLAQLFSQHNEHRLLFPRLLLLGLDVLTGFDTRAQMALSFVFLLATGAVLLVAHCRRRGGFTSRALWEFTPIALLLFTVRQAENLIWGWQLQIFMTVFFIVCTVELLDQVAPSRLALASVCGVLASFSFANGLLIWPVGCLGLALPSKLPRSLKALATWTGIGVATIALYLHGYVKPSHHPSLLTSFRHPIAALQYFLEAIGNPFSDRANVAIGFGLAVLLMLTVVLVRRAEPLACTSAHLKIAFALMSAALLMLGRSGFGSDQALSSRYVTFMILAFVGVYELALEGWADRWGAAVCGGLFAMVLSTQPTAWNWARSFGRSQRDQRSSLAALLPFRANLPDEALAPLFPGTPMVREYSDFLEAKRLSVFRTPPQQYEDKPLYQVEAVNDLPVARCSEIESSVATRDSLRIRGWAVDDHGQRPAAAVLLNVDDHQRFPARLGIARPEIATALKHSGYRASGFVCDIPRSALPAGPHQISIQVIGTDGGLYPAQPVLSLVVP